MTEPKPEPPRKESGGWLQRLAQKSAGLAKDESDTAANQDEREANNKLWRLGGLGLQMGATCALFWWMGYAVDRHMGWSYGGQMGFTMFAVAGSMYLMIKEALKSEK